MSDDPLKILVVDDEENLNWSIVNSLLKDGYDVKGVLSGEAALEELWANEFNAVITDVKMPGMDGFELLMWLRSHRPDTHVLMVTAFGSPSVRTQALQTGVISYIEKPFDLRVLKDELRRMFHQSGFTADLETFDLLDIAQILNISRRDICLKVQTGIEGYGMLRFAEGELVWAEFGELQGEDAFFALAAHKAGNIVERDCEGDSRTNVALPLQRLVLQALQYRDKYASGQLEGQIRLPFEELPQEDPWENDNILNVPTTEQLLKSIDEYLDNNIEPVTSSKPASQEDAESALQMLKQLASHDMDLNDETRVPPKHIDENLLKISKAILIELGKVITGLQSAVILHQTGQIIAGSDGLSEGKEQVARDFVSAIGANLPNLTHTPVGKFEDLVVSGNNGSIIARCLGDHSDYFLVLFLTGDAHLEASRHMLSAAAVKFHKKRFTAKNMLKALEES